MSLHLRHVLEPHRAVCGGNAARLTADPGHDGLNCHICLAIIESAQRPEPKHAARPPHPNTMAGRK